MKSLLLLKTNVSSDDVSKNTKNPKLEAVVVDLIYIYA